MKISIARYARNVEKEDFMSYFQMCKNVSTVIKPSRQMATVGDNIYNCKKDMRTDTIICNFRTFTCSELQFQRVVKGFPGNKAIIRVSSAAFLLTHENLSSKIH